MNHISRRIAVTTILTGATSFAVTPLLARNPKSPEKALPKVNISGKPNQLLVPFDELMTRFVHDHTVPGAALAVTRDSQLVYARGFGWADTEAKRPVQPESLFRIASLSKPLTAVAVLQLVAAQKLGLDQHVFDVLLANEWLPPKHDVRLQKITIRQLLQHTAGWDRDKSFDPITRPHQISKSVNRPLPVGPEDVIRYALTLPLDHAPGTQFAYSNVGFLILGRLIEHASGQQYAAYVKEHVLKPVGVTRMQLGRAWKDDLANGEVHYYDARHREKEDKRGL